METTRQYKRTRNMDKEIILAPWNVKTTNYAGGYKNLEGIALQETKQKENNIFELGE